MVFKDIARIIRPENKLKKKIGNDVNMREILQPDVHQTASKILTDKKEDFLSWAAESLQELEKAYYALNNNVGEATIQLSSLTKHAESLRDRSGTFGYYLGSDIARTLAKYCAHSSPSNPHLAVVTRKHLDGLTIVFKDNVTDSGGAIGQELLTGLKQLVEKYPAV